MTTPSRYGVGTGVISGSIGGLVGGLVMIPFFIMMAMAAGLPLDAVSAARGMAFGAPAASAAAVGMVMHLATSVIIGMIFGAVTSKVQKLRVISYSKGMGLGLITGMIVFVVLYLPLNMLVTSPVLARMMAGSTGMTDQQAATAVQQSMPVMMTIAIAEHLAYGAVLGGLTAALVINAMKRRARAEGFVCSSCQQQFSSAQGLNEHVRTAHHGVAA